ncbi:hypothetical protein LPJ56_000427 [Coemansia sp. RSA 2599]|nr:hypothetical protein LPJ56_000427 [Coemansia sp. RSA 2599]
MSVKQGPCHYFDTPEGRWSLVSEFTTEDAANQFHPHIARDINGDDLSIGPSGSESHHAPLPTPPASSASSASRFGAAGTAMVTGGFIFGDSRPQMGSVLANSSNVLKSQGQQQQQQHQGGFIPANRPTHISVFCNSCTPSASTTQLNANSTGSSSFIQGIGNESGAHYSESGEQPPTQHIQQQRQQHSKAGNGHHGFRHGLLNLGKSGAASSSAAQSTNADGGALSDAATGGGGGGGNSNSNSNSNSNDYGNGNVNGGGDGWTSRLAIGPVGVASSKGIVTKSTSAYVSRLVTNENIAKWIVGDGVPTTNFLFNAPRTMAWLGMQPETNSQTLARFDLVSSTPLCHAINHSTRSSNRLDVVMGFVHGNIIWYEPISGKYTRLNKNSGYSPAILCLGWIPGSPNLFMAGTSDGCVMIIDRLKEDFALPKLVNPIHPSAATAAAAGSSELPLDAFETASVLRSKTNPVAYWKLSNKPITSLSFSPDTSSHQVAITGEDGALRIVNYSKETLEAVYPSYFGGLTCCAWSDDAKYIVSGGKDDLITIWSANEQTIVARCVGHESWVRSIAFDPLGHEDESTYRFMSVGEDSRLIVWDFSLAGLHRPRLSAKPLSSGMSLREHLSGRPGVEDSPSDIVHPRMPRDTVPVLQPLVSAAIHDTAMCSLQLTRELLVTACRRGIVKVWRRPATFDLDKYI